MQFISILGISLDDEITARLTHGGKVVNERLLT